MSRLVLGLFLILLVGCKGGSDGAGSSPTIPDPPIPGPQKPTVWGDLNCQKEKNCQNPIFNLDFYSLQKFWSHFSLIGSSQGVDMSFSCGIHFQKMWIEKFPEHSYLDQQESAEVLGYADKVLSLPSCSIRDDLVKLHEEYFLTNLENENEKL